MASNPERSVAFSFRHADYLGCGLPILTGTDTALADVLDGAGWVDDDVEAALDHVIDDPGEVRRRSRAARELARTRFALDVCEAPLVRWVAEGRRSARTAPFVEPGALADEAARERTLREAAEVALARAEAELGARREEVARLGEQVRLLASVSDRLSRAIDEVAGFKREAIAVLGAGSEQARTESRELHREVATLRADIAKKTAEVQALQVDRDRLQGELDESLAEAERLRSRGFLRR
jgi:hypothetical protein